MAAKKATTYHVDYRTGLKDFQLKTVDYVYEQFYRHGKNRMLVADEVGLGKTIVAKGIIAKAYQNFLSTYDGRRKSNPEFNVVYICSNLALARQNIRKLNFTGSEDCVEENINRLTYLALDTNSSVKTFRINSLTPGTSFDQKSSMGEAGERAILYHLLINYDMFRQRSNRLQYLLKGTSHIDSFKAVCNYYSHKIIRRDLPGKFRQELFTLIVRRDQHPRIFEFLQPRSDMSLWKALVTLCDQIDGRNHHLFVFPNEVIRVLRRILSYLCLEYLGADIFILDEFQRYSALLKKEESSDPAIELAKKVFGLKDAKVLMLSATPFKPYTNDFDESCGEDHYSEFKTVLHFLMEEETESFWKSYESDRRQLFRLIRHSDEFRKKIGSAIVVKERLENMYRKSIVRTERLLASDNHEAMIHHEDAGQTLKLQVEDIEDFVVLDKITQHLNKTYNNRLNVPIEYVKSCPYALSFLDNYQHKEKLKKVVAQDTELVKLLRQSSHGWLDISRIDKYLPLISLKGKVAPNAKLRMLIEKTVSGRTSEDEAESTQHEGWKYLWVPASLTYYEHSGPFANSDGFSKTLIFSSWKMVPRMVAGLISYEAERLSIGKAMGEDKKYFLSSSHSVRLPRPQITFKNSSGSSTPDQLNNFMLSYPSLFLSDLYHPSENLAQHLSLKEIKRRLAETISQHIKELPAYQNASKGGDVRKWYWLAPILLDQHFMDTAPLISLLNSQSGDTDTSTDAESISLDKDEGSGKTAHRKFVRNVLAGSEIVEFSAPDDEQLENLSLYLANLALGSPAICTMRALRNHFELSSGLLQGTYLIAAGFTALFNKPESVAIIRLTTQAKDFYHSVLEYSISGNLQAVLDEYVYLLHHCENYSDPLQLAKDVCDLMSIRSSSVTVDDLKSFYDAAKRDSEELPKKHVLRTHYAIYFGNQKLAAAGSERQVNMRQAFNSPFRPFVLATTSIGQEGLDFHLYCKKIIHWNLPCNPVDFEQREGRIHRYKGHVIRLNLAKKYGDKLIDPSPAELWKTLFELAAKEKYSAKVPSDLVPFWHTNNSTTGISIERYVPMYPFSKDIGKLRHLLKVLAYYRLTFGQPRQEDLVEALADAGYQEEEIKELNKLMINLSPQIFMNQQNAK